MSLTHDNLRRYDELTHIWKRRGNLCLWNNCSPERANY
jgi:hypothetical protein